MQRDDRLSYPELKEICDVIQKCNDFSDLTNATVKKNKIIGGVIAGFNSTKSNIDNPALRKLVGLLSTNFSKKNLKNLKKITERIAAYIEIDDAYANSVEKSKQKILGDISAMKGKPGYDKIEKDALAQIEKIEEEYGRILINFESLKEDEAGAAHDDLLSAAKDLAIKIKNLSLPDLEKPIKINSQNNSDNILPENPAAQINELDKSPAGNIRRENIPFVHEELTPPNLNNINSFIRDNPKFLQDYAAWLAAETIRLMCSVNIQTKDIKHLIDRLKKILEINNLFDLNKNEDNQLLGQINEVLSASKKADEYEKSAFFSDHARIATLDNVDNIISGLKDDKNVNADLNSGGLSSGYFKTTNKDFVLRVTCNTFPNSTDNANLKLIAVQNRNSTGARIDFKFSNADIEALSNTNLLILAIRQVEDFRCLVKPPGQEVTNSFDIPINILPGTHPKLAGAIIFYCKEMIQYECNYDRQAIPFEKENIDNTVDIREKIFGKNRPSDVLSANKKTVEKTETAYQEILSKQSSKPHKLM